MSSGKDHLDLANIPEHIAIIMDGNGRWAKKRRLPRLAGHKKGSETLKKILEECDSLGVKHLTVYAFSTENWNRPEEEVKGLMNLLINYINSELKTLMKNKIRINVLGDIEGLPDKVRENVLMVMERTAENDRLCANIALNYGGRDEIIRATRKVSEDVKAGKLSPEMIDESVFSDYLYTRGIPDPDLMIRTSGEIRLSNFLLWQLAYSEFYFTDVYWPDFSTEHLHDAILEYQNRNRRYGKL